MGAGWYVRHRYFTAFQILLKFYLDAKRIYFGISYYFEMKAYPLSLCSPRKPGPEKRSVTNPDVGLEAIEHLGGVESLSRHIPAEKDLLEQSRRYNALSDPLRLKILYLLRDQPLCVCVINQFMHISGPKLSYHLAILKESGLIEGECRGNWIYYSLTETGRDCIG